MRYAALEADKLSLASKEIGWKDWLRRNTFLAPPLTLLYCLFIRGLILDGRAGLFYSVQRVVAELALFLELTDRRLRLPREKHCSVPLAGEVQ
jgi:hypothetical protein